MINRIKDKVQVFTCILAVLCLAYGIGRGEVAVVLNKAINICLECIGLG
ncbi:CD1871A family CXXC motif-containing protein [Alkaliphilus crotonatoxidans]